MATFLERAIKLTGRGFDIERKKLMPPGTTLEFLEFDDETNAFALVEELEDKWNFGESKRYASFPVFESGSPVFKASVAKNNNDADFIETINRATHVRVKNETYIIRPNFTHQPDGDEPCWRFYCERHLSRSQFV